MPCSSGRPRAGGAFVLAVVIVASAEVYAIFNVVVADGVHRRRHCSRSSCGRRVVAEIVSVAAGIGMNVFKPSAGA